MPEARDVTPPPRHHRPSPRRPEPGSGSAASAVVAEAAIPIASSPRKVPLPSLPDSIQFRALGLQLVADFWFWGRCTDVQKEEKKLKVKALDLG